MTAVLTPTQAHRDHCEKYYSSKTDCKSCPPDVRSVCHGGPVGVITAEVINRHILAMDSAIKGGVR